MSIRNVVNFTGVADRLALFIANEAMRKLAWSNRPELLMEKLQQIDFANENVRQYLVTYPLMNSRDTFYEVEVTLYRGTCGQNGWPGADVVLTHLSRAWKFCVHIDIEYDDELDGMIQKIVFGKFVAVRVE